MEEARRRTLHGRRRGKKLRAGQQSLLDTLLPRLAVALPAEPSSRRKRRRRERHKIDLAQLFGGPCRLTACGWKWASAPASIWCGRPSIILTSG